MGKIVASSYEILQKIGSGGGGVVYLGRHLRLNKQIVLKEYKRTAATKPSSLSREVDALKNLSHTYIPQVYDYVEEDGNVYSVMDFIEGESLDGPLRRGERFPQSKVVEWAGQLLDALCYLHSRPPYGILHSDIKPANIMLTPQGDIRLIDFNIALALGEEGAVRVGFSRGYASPEHYGIAYAPPSARIDPAKTQVSAETQLPTAPDTRLSRGSRATNGSVLLDVRSDIYSLGATLYHLFTGRRPAQDAGEVTPIQPQEASPAVAAIIQKAMALNPAERYQTAEEMLRAFRRLPQDDPRAKRHKRRGVATASALAALFLTGALCAFVGLGQMEQVQQRERLAAEAARQALSLISASERAARDGDVDGAAAYAAGALDLESPYASQAQKALTDALGVYDLSAGFRPCRSWTLPSAPLKTALSPEGSRAAAVVSGQALVFDTASGDRLAALPMDASALADAVFAGENTILYGGKGALRAYDLLAGEELWSSKPATGIALSGDGSTVAAVYKDENLAAVYRAGTGEAIKAVSFQEKRQGLPASDAFADPEDSLFSLSESGEWLAVSFSDGGLRLFDLRDGGKDLEIFHTSEYRHFEGGFSGRYFAFSASREGESVFAVLDLETGEQTGGFTSPNPFHVHADREGVLVSTENLLVALDPVTGEQRELAYGEADITAFSRGGPYTLTALSSGSISVFDERATHIETRDGPCDFVAAAGEWALLANRDTPILRLLRLETHPEARIFTYDRDYPHDEARVSGGGTVMLYRYDRFRLYGPDGSLLEDAVLPDSGQVYDQQYRRGESGDYLEVLYRDGTVRAYSTKDGSLLFEEAGTPPEASLDEEFYTDSLRIAAPLHGAAAAYSLETGELVRELERDDYLTYATQVGEYVVTEYVTSQGGRYGLLLDKHCETLARLPDLCDILPDGTLVFDDMRGTLRESRIYSIEELRSLAQNK